MVPSRPLLEVERPGAGGLRALGGHRRQPVVAGNVIPDGQRDARQVCARPRDAQHPTRLADVAELRHPQRDAQRPGTEQGDHQRRPDGDDVDRLDAPTAWGAGNRARAATGRGRASRRPRRPGRPRPSGPRRRRCWQSTGQADGWSRRLPMAELLLMHSSQAGYVETLHGVEAHLHASGSTVGRWIR